MSESKNFKDKSIQVLKWCFLIAFLSTSTVLGYIAYKVFLGDVTELQKSAILAKINEETSLYYLDEKTQIGSIFERRHRRYVPLEEIPSYMLNAIVAAEDKNFYQHVGIDPIAIAGAASEGILKGRFKRGGSSITQQTIKNITHNWEMSFGRKFNEMIKAFQLEKLYSKQQILEFYLNQFHVAGNGSGLNVAARYYFNKEVQDLNLLESAFIAGSVKGPSKYNPFIKYGKPSKDAARKSAFHRKNYVLKRMLEHKWISEAEYKDAVKATVPFNRGKFRSAEVSLVDLVKLQLEKPEVLEALGLANKHELNIAGLKVFTTLDYDIQHNAQLAMRRNLSRLATILNGFTTENPKKYKPLRNIKENAFLYGKVLRIEGDSPDNYKIILSFGSPTGEISNASLTRYARLLNLVDGKGYKVHLKKMIEQVEKDSILFVQVASFNKEKQHAQLEMHKRPLISGGLIALDQGEVRAMVSGFDTMGYNRAMFATRQPGSVFKALVYFAALQLGWSSLDLLGNTRQVFPYQGEFYYPRFDHISPYKSVSMLWSGVMSENLATIALGARLLEKLNFEQFKTLLHSMDLSPLPSEKPADFHYRISKAMGVSVDHNGIRAFQMREAVNDISADLIFNNQDKVLENLKLMWWGKGAEEEILRLRNNDNDKISAKEIQTRIRLAQNNFQRYQAQRDMLKNDWLIIEQKLQQTDLETVFSDPEMQTILDRFRVLPLLKATPELAYYAQTKEWDEELVSIEREPIPLPPLEGRKLNILDIQGIWSQSEYFSARRKANITIDQVYLNGTISGAILEQVEQLTEQKTQETLDKQDPFHLYRYFKHHDFRIALGLNYITRLAKASGVYNRLDPVLSFPLGSSDVSVGEVAKIYQTIATGKIYRFFKEGPLNQLTFIRRIEDRFGNVIYEPQKIVEQLVDPLIAQQTREILKKTITHGTGRRARGELYVGIDTTDDEGNDQVLKIRVPAYGKTGTTNDFQTSSFAGFVPYPVESEGKKPLGPERSYVMAAYVGYDFNREMVRGRQRIYGGNGALPLWTDVAKSILKSKDYTKYIDQYDLTILSRKEWPLKQIATVKPYLVDLPQGIILRQGDLTDMEIWQTTNIEAEGERYQDLFAPGSSVRSVMYLPQGDTYMDITKRIFKPFIMPDPENDAQKEALLDPIPTNLPEQPPLKHATRSAP